MNINPIQVAITVGALVAILSPLLLWAFQAGRLTSATGKTPRFDRVVPDVHLNDTWWHVEFDAEAADSAPLVAKLHLYQVGGRVFGEALSTDGSLHSFEGLLHGRRLSYVALDDDRRTERTGTVLLEVLSGDSRMIGVRSRWSGVAEGLLMRKVTFTRLNSANSVVEHNVNR